MKGETNTFHRGEQPMNEYRRLLIGALCLGFLWFPASRLAAEETREVTLGELTAVEEKDHVYTLSAGADRIRVQFLREDIFRIQLGPDGHFSDPSKKSEDTPMVVQPGIPIPVTLADTGEYWKLSSRECVLRIYKKPLRFALFDRQNAVLVWKEERSLTYGPETYQRLTRGETEYFYGCGMQNGYFSHRDRTVAIAINYGKWNDGTTSNPAPFFMSTGGYGVFRHTFAPGAYEFLAPVRISHEECRFDAYYFYGPSLKKILEGYTWLTGRPFLPPRWGIEYGDADCYNKTGTTSDVIAKVAAAYRQNDLPAGWILPNDGYGCGYRDLENTVAELHKLGFYTGLWTENGVERIAQEVGKMGIRVMKLDVAWVGPGYQFALNGCRSAFAGIELNSNARGFVWSVGGWAGTQRYSTIWSGDQAGNWEYIRFHIPTILGAGLSGFNCATGDVDGIFGGGAQTCVRDLQWKALTPVWMIISGWSKQTNLKKQPWIFGEPYTAINRKYLKLKMRLKPYIYSYCRQAYDTGVPAVRAMVLEFPGDPFTWGKQTQYQFMSGEWLLAAPVYEDTTVRDGIYLPAGKWIDYWDGRVYNGPQMLNRYDAPLEKLPMFVRAGAIIPLYPEMLHDREKPFDPLTLDIYPFQRTAFTLYEDDGATQAFRSGGFAKTLIEVEAAGDSWPLTVTIGAAAGGFPGQIAARTYELQIHIGTKPGRVSIGKTPLLESPTAGDHAKGHAGWWFDAGDRGGIVHVRTPRLPIDKPQQVLIRN